MKKANYKSLATRVVAAVGAGVILAFGGLTMSADAGKRKPPPPPVVVVAEEGTYSTDGNSLSNTDGNSLANGLANSV